MIVVCVTCVKPRIKKILSVFINIYPYVCAARFAQKLMCFIFFSGLNTVCKSLAFINSVSKTNNFVKNYICSIVTVVPAWYCRQINWYIRLNELL